MASGRRERTADRGRHLQAPPERSRVGALDGLRTLAVISVLLYHLGVAWLPSGHMGVVIFLVLTGYLVTSSIGKGKDEHGFGAVVRLIGRRVARLWPPMALMIAVAAALCVAFSHVLLTKMRPDILPALGFFENIAYILSNQSYFEALGAPSPLTHLWYLGVDMQFCLIWAPIAYLAFGRGGRSHPWGRVLALVGALASAILMGVLFDPTGDPSRVYYGTDTRAFALLLGAWLGMARPLGADASIFERVDFRGRRHELVSPSAFELMGAIGLVAIIAIMILVPGKSGLYYYGLMAFVALCAAALIMALASDGVLSVVFGLPAFTWLGERSYSLYLWHYPIILLMGAQTNTAPWWLKLLAVAVSFAAAIISYELVERPLAEGAFREGVAGFPSSLAEASLLRKVATGLVALSCVVAIVGTVFVPDKDILPEDAISNVGASADSGMELPQVTEPTEESQSQAATYEQDPNDIPEGQIQLRAPLAEVSSGMFDPVLIGDSVPTALRDIFPQACPNGLLDAYVARRPDQALSVMQDYISRGIVGHVVIYATFSNVPVADSELDSLVEVCGERKVFLVDVHIPEVEMTQINDALYRCADRHDNVEVIRWDERVSSNLDWLYADGEHLREPEGANGYIELINQSVARAFVENGGNAMRLDDALQIRGVVADIVEKIGFGDASALRDSSVAVSGGAEGQLDYHDANIDQGADLGGD